jgi:glucuronoarabinoxylan endo-1,4-beta-xylanase
LTKFAMVLGPGLLAAMCIWLAVAYTTGTATVEWSAVRQTIDGFGGSSADFLDGLTPKQADFFFTQTGIGLSILRTQMIPDAATCDAEFKKGACSDSNGQILNGELTTAQLAVARGATVFATPWSPPGMYKSNHSFRNGGELLREHYADWAGEMAAYVTMMAGKGVRVDAVSVQNEPNLKTDYGSCLYTGQEIHDFVPFLHAALEAAGVGSTKIMIAEEATWADDLTSAAMKDPAVATDVGIVAAHGYHATIQPLKTGAARMWQTEDSSQSPTYDGSIGDGIAWALKIHSFLKDAGVNAWVWWFLTDMPRQGEGRDNAALTDIHGNIPKRAWVTGQWSRFVRPGWSRIDVSYFGPLAITAFKDPAGRSFAVVVVNSSKQPVRQEFAFAGMAASEVTPWITAKELSLAAQAPVPVNGGGFSYELPAQSVTTFVGSAAGR